MYQSPQSSDNDDKKFNVWNDIFLDTVDPHEYMRRQNRYGPVLFKFSIDFLIETDLEIWITKNNPIYWTDLTIQAEKYFATVQELRESWDSYQRQKKMVTIRGETQPILFNYSTWALGQLIIEKSI